MIRTMVVTVMLAAFATSAAAQQLPVTGKVLGKSKIVFAESAEGRSGAGASVLASVGFGIAEKGDLYFAVGADQDGFWDGIGWNVEMLKEGDFSVSMSGLARFGGDFSMTPRIIVNKEFDSRVNLFGGATFYMTPANSAGGWAMPIGATVKLDRKLTLIAEVTHGQGRSVRASVVYNIK